jgi:hypothetical protein
MEQPTVAVVSVTENESVDKQTYPITKIIGAFQVPKADIIIWLDDNYHFADETVVQEIVDKFLDMAMTLGILYTDVSYDGEVLYNQPFARNIIGELNQPFAFFNKEGLNDELPLDSYLSASKYILGERLGVHIAKPMFLHTNA